MDSRLVLIKTKTDDALHRRFFVTHTYEKCPDFLAADVNNKDMGLLRRWLNDWDVEIDELASDVNRDGNVNNKDLGLLRRYLNDWDVELK